MSGNIGELRDQLSIETPELVEIQFPLAGLGSRFLALFLDYLFQLAAIFVLLLVAATLLPSLGTYATLSEKWTIAILILIPFLLHWGYFTLFEAFWKGQTPGKNIAKIRVIQETGRPIQLFESMGRNLVRFIDAVPGFYGVGMVSIFLTKRQQRLGDLVAGTLVIHERRLEPSLETLAGSRTFTAELFPRPPELRSIRPSGLPADRVARLSADDLSILDSFLARRLDLPLEASARLAQKLAVEMARRMEYPLDASVSYETFLEGLAHDLRGLKR